MGHDDTETAGIRYLGTRCAYRPTTKTCSVLGAVLCLLQRIDTSLDDQILSDRSEGPDSVVGTGTRFGVGQMTRRRIGQSYPSREYAAGNALVSHGRIQFQHGGRDRWHSHDSCHSSTGLGTWIDVRRKT